MIRSGLWWPLFGIGRSQDVSAGKENMARASRYKEYLDGMNDLRQKKAKDRGSRRPVSILRQLKELKRESAKTISQKGGINGQ